MSIPLTRPHTKWGVAIALGLLGSLVVGLVVLAFLWPAKTSTPQNLPVGITGPAATVSALQEAVTSASPDAFDFTEATDRADAVAQIENRQTYGAIVLGAPGTAPEVLTAPAASAAATQILTGVATQLQAQLVHQVSAAGGDPSSVAVEVTPVVPLSAEDPAGTGLAAASFPLTLGGMLGGILISFLVVGPIRRLVALAGFGVGVGVILALILQTWFGFLQGDFWLNVTGMGLSIVATSAFIVGCTSLLGSRGIAVGAILTLFVGNPLASAAAPWQFLPTPWGAIGQFLVPGASNWLLRALSYFPNADLSQQWWTLIAWVTLGAVLIVAGHFRSRAAARVPANTLESEPHTVASV
ncbi:hypothetical protein GCM10027413_10090 [Conyzicola nivalis]|uniref:ABC transporter permease n=1 Tax=Conyzicola nivalis TaxID=1477021 RepID=A0A916SJJ4_9MICO|nr:hypothetical protein [Conyzicola nivalis]GGB02588.1 hypothetical protein GCM10010979_16530 [Conyzicola nivalis]